MIIYHSNVIFQIWLDGIIDLAWYDGNIVKDSTSPNLEWRNFILRPKRKEMLQEVNNCTRIESTYDCWSRKWVLISVYNESDCSFYINRLLIDWLEKQLIWNWNAFHFHSQVWSIRSGSLKKIILPNLVLIWTEKENISFDIL